MHGSIELGGRLAVPGGVLRPDAEPIQPAAVEVLDRVAGDSAAHLRRGRVVDVLFLSHVDDVLRDVTCAVGHGWFPAD